MGYKKTKYKSEAEMCEDVTMLISAMISPTRHKHIPEVPRTSGNNHSDMLFIRDNGYMFVVEYKLAGVKDLFRQVRDQYYKIGIINQKFEEDKNNLRDGDYTYRGKIFPYTGEDHQLEAIAKRVQGHRCNDQFGSTRHDHHELMVYWWGYMCSKSSLLGGIQNGKRKSFFEVYKRAIVNLQLKYNNKLYFDLVYSVLGFYGKANARKHYNDAMKKLLLDK